MMKSMQVQLRGPAVNDMSPPDTSALLPFLVVNVTRNREASTAPGEYSSTKYGCDLNGMRAKLNNAACPPPLASAILIRCARIALP